MGLKVPASLEVGSEVVLGVGRPGWEMRPLPMPRERGRRRERGVEVKMLEGRVREGM